jgi:hypothetical protein
MSQSFSVPSDSTSGRLMKKYFSNGSIDKGLIKKKKIKNQELFVCVLFMEANNVL